MMKEIFSKYVQMFFLLTPFFLVSSFLTMTAGFDDHVKKRIAIRTSLAIVTIVFIIFFFGNYIFEVLGITLDAFRIGAGALLFLTAISLVKGTRFFEQGSSAEEICVVPLAIPISVGPGTIGALMVLSLDNPSLSARLWTSLPILAAVISISLLLILSNKLEKHLGSAGLSMLSKVTGVVISALAADIVFTGVKNILAI